MNIEELVIFVRDGVTTDFGNCGSIFNQLFEQPIFGIPWRGQHQEVMVALNEALVRNDSSRQLESLPKIA